MLTLVINGLTLAGFIRVFGVRGDGNAEREERAARIAIAQAAGNAPARVAAQAQARRGDRASRNGCIDEYERQLASPLRQRRPPAQTSTRWPTPNASCGSPRCAPNARNCAKCAKPTSSTTRTLRSIEAEIDHAESLRRRPTALPRSRLMASPRAPVALLGGTFDPVHYGHLRFADEVRRALGLAELRLVPAGDPPHRAGPSPPRRPARDARARDRRNSRASSSTSANSRGRARATRCSRSRSCAREFPQRPAVAAARRRRVPRAADVAPVARDLRARARRRRRAARRARSRDDMPAPLLAEWNARRTRDPAVLFSTPAGAIYEQRDHAAADRGHRDPRATRARRRGPPGGRRFAPAAPFWPILTSIASTRPRPDAT